jgi:hypothetical protein
VQRRSCSPQAEYASTAVTAFDVLAADVNAVGVRSRAHEQVVEALRRGGSAEEAAQRTIRPGAAGRAFPHSKEVFGLDSRVRGPVGDGPRLGQAGSAASEWFALGRKSHGKSLSRAAAHRGASDPHPSGAKNSASPKLVTPPDGQRPASLRIRSAGAFSCSQQYRALRPGSRWRNRPFEEQDAPAEPGQGVAGRSSSHAAPMTTTSRRFVPVPPGSWERAHGRTGGSWGADRGRKSSTPLDITNSVTRAAARPGPRRSSDRLHRGNRARGQPRSRNGPEEIQARILVALRCPPGGPSRRSAL